MNKIHKIIWSKVRHCYVVVSEITKRDGKSVGGFFTGKKRNLTLALLTFLSLSSVISFPVYADTIGTYHAGDLKWDKDNHKKAEWDPNHPVTDEDYGSIGLRSGKARLSFLMGLISGDTVAGKEGGLAEELKHRTAIGNKFRVFGFGATAYGYGTNAVGEGSLAVGHAATTNGNEGTAIGSYAKVLKGQGTVVGANSWANDQAVALGADVRAQGYASISIGSDDADPKAFTGSKFSDKLPEETIKKIYKDMIKDNPDWFKNKYMLDSTGNDRRVWSPNYAAGEAAIAIGARTVALGDASTSIGVLSMALAERSTALGVRSLVSKDAKGGMALGEESRVMSKDGLAVGNKTYSSGDGSLAYGYDAKALGANSIAIGHNVGANAMLNHEAQDTMANVLLYNGEGKIKPTGTSFDTTQDRINYLEKIMADYDKKDKQWVDDEGSVLRQWKDGNNGPYRTEYRKKQAQVGPKQWSDNAIAIGRRTYAIGDNSLVLGSLSLGAGNNSLNVGHFTYTKGENSAAIGMESAAIADNSMAIGVRSFANLTNSIAVGVGSKTDYTKEDLEQDGWAPRNAITFPSSTQVGVVSVGKIGSERRISNVASGYRDTDAVNVSQLRSLEERFSSNLPEDSDLNPFSYLAVDKMRGDVTKVIPLQKKEMNYRKYVNYRIKQIELQVREKNKEKVDETFKDRIQNVITNLEKGDNKTGIDASGLKGKNVDTILNELKAKYPGLDTSDTNDVINKLNEWKKEKLKDSLKKALTNDEQGFLDGTNYLNDGAKGKDAIAVGYKAQSLADNSVAIGKESRVEKGAQGGIALGASSSATRAGGQRAYDFDNDRVFADDNAAGKGNGGIHANKSDTGALSIGSANYTRQITNVAGGSEDTDAVNVAQLKQVNNKINGVDTKINSVDTKVNNVNDKVEGNIGFNIEGNSGGQPWVAAGTKDSQKGKISLKIRGGDNDSNINVDLGRVTKDGFDTIEAKINLNHNLGNLESATFTKTEKGVTTTSVINDKGLTVGSGNTAVALTKDGLNMGSHQIHGVAEGKADTDAVNVAQVNKAIQAKADELKKNEIKAAQDTANTANSNATEAKTTANTAKTTAEQAKSTADTVNKDLASYKTEVTGKLNNKANTGLDNLTQSGKTVVKNLAKEQIDTTVTETFVTDKVKKGSVKSTTLTVTGNGKVVSADLTLEIKDKAISKGKLSDELVKEIEGKATKDEVAKKAEKTYVDNQLNTKVNTSDFTTYKNEVTTALGKKADTETVNQQLATKVNTSDFTTYKGQVTADLAKKADVDGGNITAPGQWAGKLGTGEVVENNANLVTGGKVFAAIKDKADKSELTNKADTSLNNITGDGKTVIKDLAKGAVKVAAGTNTTVTTEDGTDGSKTYKVNVSDADIKKAVASDLNNKADKDAGNIGDTERTAWANKLGTGKVEANDANLVTGGTVQAAIKDKANTSLDNLTEQGKTKVKDLAGEKITETVTNTFVTDKVTKGSIKSDTLDVTGDGKAIGSDLTINIKDGSITKAKLNNDLKIEIEGKATKDEVAKKAEKTYVDNQLNTKVNTSDFTTYKNEVTTALGKKADTETVNQQLATKVNTSDFTTYKGQVTADLAKKADVDGGNITAPGQWAGKLGTGEVAENNANLVTGGKVFAAIKDKADKSELTNKAETSLNNITEAGKTVIKDLAKGAVKVAAGTNTTVTTEDGKDGSKTYKVNVSDANIKKAVASDLDNKANKDASNIDDTAKAKWAEKLGTGKVEANDANLVTGGTVQAALKPVKTQAETNATNITGLTTRVGKNESDIKTLQGGFTLQDANTKVGKQTVKAGSTVMVTGDKYVKATVNDKGLTLGLNEDTLNQQINTQITSNSTVTGKMSAWKLKATGDKKEQEIKDGNTVIFDAETDKGLTVSRVGNTIKYGIEGSKIDLTNNTAITNINNILKADKATVVAGDYVTVTTTANTEKGNTFTVKGPEITGEGSVSVSDIEEGGKKVGYKITGKNTTLKAETTGLSVADGKLKLNVADTDNNAVTGEVDLKTLDLSGNTTINNLDTKIENITKTNGLLDNKADKDASNIGDTERTAWAGKLGTGTVAANDTNLVTGKTVYDFVNPIKTKADNNETAITKLQTGFTIKDAGTGTSDVALGGDKPPAITFKAATAETDGATSSLVASVDADKNVTYTLNTKKLKEDLGITGKGVGSMSSWKIQATGGTATNVADGETVEFGKVENQGLTVTQTGKTIKYGIDIDKVIENINSSTTKKITNVDGDNIDLSKNTYITNITKTGGLLDNKANKDASNIGDTERTAWANKLGTGTVAENDTNLVTGKTVKAALDKKVDTSTYTEGMAKKADVDGGNITVPGKWAEKLGTGEVAENNANLVTGGKVFAAIKDKADKSELTNKADTSLNNITEGGKTVIKNLAKGAVKVADGTNTTVTTEDGKDGSKTYKVNVSDADIKKAVASDLDNKADKNTVTADLAKKADKDASNIGDTERTAWANKLGTGTISDNDANLVTGGTVKAALDKKVDTSTYTEGMAKKVDVDGGNITAPGQWANKLGTGKVAANDANLVTGKTVYDFVNPIKTKADNNETAITKLQTGFTIKDAGTGTSDVALGGDKPPAITFKAATATTDGATSSFVASVDADKNVTYTLNTKKLKEDLGITGKGVGTMSSWKVQATGGTATNVADGETVEFGTEENQGLTVKQTGKTIKYGINTDTVIDNINNSTTKKITNVDGDKIDISNNSAVTNINSKLTAGFNVKAGDTAETVGLDNKNPETVEFKAVSENNSLTVGITKDDTTHTKTITYKLADDLTFGKAGENGKDGTLGVNGKDGSSVTINGKDGSIGLNGTNGQNGLSIRGEKGKEGKPGVDGTTTIKRIVITDPDGKNPHSVATLDDGLKFKGDIGDAAPIKLNNQVNIVGGETVADNLSDGNIGVDTTKEGNDAKLTVKLAKNLKNLESATFTKTEKGVTTTSVINDKGLTIGNDTDSTKNVSLTKDGLNMAEQEIKNVKESTTTTSAATVGQINKAKEALKTEIDKKADKDASNIGDAERTAWAGKLGTGKVEANDTNLVTGGTVQAALNPVKTQAETNATNITGLTTRVGKNESDIKTLQEGFTIQDEATPTVGKKVIKAKDTITFKSGANLTSKVGDDGSVTYGLNTALTNMNSITFAAPTAPAGGTSKALTINGTAGTITGLTNTTWDGKTIVTGRAATEDQLKALSETVSGNASSSTDFRLVASTDTKGYTPDTSGKVTLDVKDKNHENKDAYQVTISDVASKSSLDALKEEMKKNIQVGGKGANGADGVDGTIGVNGADGKPGIGINGKDGGSITIHGTNGTDGQDGQNGLTIRGVDGKNGEKGEKGVDGKDINRIVTVDPNGTKHQLATLDDGLKFAGNSGNFYSKLNETVEIVGGVTVGENEKAEDKLTDENIGVVAKKEEGKNGKLDIKLAKNLKNLSSAMFTKTVENNGKKETTSTVINDSGTIVTDKDGNTNKTTADGTVIQNKDGTEKVEIKKDGLTIGNNTDATKNVSLTKDGLNMAEQEIKNVKESTTATSAATVGQVEKVKTELSNTIANKADYALAKGDGQDGAYKVTDGKITLKIKNKAKPDEAAEDVVIDDVASKSSLDTLKEEMKKNIQVGGKGADGADGVDGTIGINGKDGKLGIGINGKDGGSITIHGTNGADGQDGQNGLTIRGVDGKNGEKGEKGVDGKDVNRIVTVDPNGTKHQLATLDDGLKFAGNSGNFYSKLNETVEIVGGVTVGENEKAEDKLTDENIGVVAKKEEGKNGKLDIKLAKNLKNLSSATFTKTVENNGKKETTSTVINDSGTTVTDKDGNTNQTTAGGTVIQNKDGTEKVEIKKDGITITDGPAANPKKKISLTKDGFNNGGNKITNIADGEKNSDAATVGQVNAAKKEAMDTLTAGFDVKAGTVTGNVSLKAKEKPTIEFLSAGNGLSVDLTTDAATHTQKITYRLSDTPVFGEKAEQGEAGKPGKVGKDGKVEVIGKDGSAVVINGKDGSIGLNGTNGQNGLSIRGEKGTEGKPGVDGTTTIKRIVITDSDGNNPHSVATLDDGLKFAGDSGDAIAKKLNEAVTISGGVTEKAKLTDDNIGVIAENGQLNVKLAKTLTKLTSVSSDKFVSGNTNVDTNGITIGNDTDVNKNVSLTKDGLNMGGKKINNFESGKVEKGNTEAVTGGAVSEALEKVKTAGSEALEKYKTSNDAVVNEVKAEAKKHTTIESGDYLSVKEETVTNGGKKYTITGPSITSEDGSVTVVDNTDDKGKKIGYKLSVNTEKIAEKIGKTEIESGDKNTAEVTSTTDATTNKTTYKVNVKDMHVESGVISYDKGEGTLTLKHKDGKEVKVEGIQNTYTESGKYDEKGKKITFNRNDGKTFDVDMSKLVNGMNFGIAKLDNKINRVGSGAAALAALKPLEFDPEDKWDVAVGYGNYMGANSLALGAFYRPNENTMFSLGGSFGDGENIINVGLSMKVGKGIQRFISKAEMANRIVEQDAEIAQLKAKDAQREAEIKALREKDEQRELQMKEILKKLNMA